MPADDQNLLDILTSVPRNAKKYADDVANYVERQFDIAARATRKVLSSEWIPEPARRTPPPPPKRLRPAVPASLFARGQDWVNKHKMLTALILVALGGVTYKVYTYNTPRKKRRAKRSAVTNARTEVVVLAASPAELITRSIALDLERRGFIVYIICNSNHEEMLVKRESRQDIKPLRIDTFDPDSARAAIEAFALHLNAPQHPFHGAKPHFLWLRSLILIPSLTYPSSPIAALEPSIFSDLIVTRVINPIATLQGFLPILTASVAYASDHSLHQPPRPSILVLTPTIIPSLSPAFHAPESTIVKALGSFTSVLSAELAPLSIPVTHVRLGTFDFSPLTQKHGHTTEQAEREDTLKWEKYSREAYAHNFVSLNMGLATARGCGSSNGLGKGTSLRVLNDTIFDVMTEGKGGVTKVGMGSGVYSFVGAWAPRSLVTWMLGSKRVQEEKAHGKESDRRTSRQTLLLTPGGSDSTRETGQRDSVDGDGYVPVYREVEGDDGWKEDPNLSNGLANDIAAKLRCDDWRG